MDLAGSLTVDAKGLADLGGRGVNLAVDLDAVDPDASVLARLTCTQEEKAETAERSDIGVRWMRAEERPICPVFVVSRVLRLDLRDRCLLVSDLQCHANKCGSHLSWRPLKELVHRAPPE